jgi:membrane protein
MADAHARKSDAAQVDADSKRGDHSVAATQKPLWKGVFARFKACEATDRAASLTYYGVLALFPALIVLIALLGLLGSYPQTTNSLLAIVAKLSPAAVGTFKGPIEGVVQAKGGAGALLGVGLVGALWSASGYVGAFIRAANAFYGINEERPFWKLRPLQLAITLVTVLLLALTAVALAMSGSVAQAVGAAIGVGGSAVTIFDVVKWPLMVLIVAGIVALLYYSAPNTSQAGPGPVVLGGLVAVIAWALASAGFAFYVANFGSYNATYGAIGSVIVLLVWLWISNLALLAGLALNAELANRRKVLRS